MKTIIAIIFTIICLSANADIQVNDTNQASYFKGNGAGLTNLNPGSITGLSNSINSDMTYKDAVNEATTTGLPAYTYNNAAQTITGLSIGGLTIDGITVQQGDSVLVKNEATAATNGVYVCTSVGSLIDYVLTRRADFNNSTNIVAGDTVYCIKGTANTNTTWTMNTAGAVTVGTTPLNFVQISGATTLVGAVTGSGVGTIVTKIGSNLPAVGNVLQANDASGTNNSWVPIKSQEYDWAMANNGAGYSGGSGTGGTAALPSFLQSGGQNQLWGLVRATGNNQPFINIPPYVFKAGQNVIVGITIGSTNAQAWTYTLEYDYITNGLSSAGNFSSSFANHFTTAAGNNNQTFLFTNTFPATATNVIQAVAYFQLSGIANTNIWIEGGFFYGQNY